jgi:hypothetical protein
LSNHGATNRLGNRASSNRMVVRCLAIYELYTKSI